MELVNHGYNISDSNLYSWLKRLNHSDFLSNEKRIINERVRNYYSITELGREVLGEIKEFLKELFHDIMEVK